MKCISAAFKAALKQDFGEEHTLRRRPFPVLSFSKTQKSAHLENKPIVGAESPPPVVPDSRRRRAERQEKMDWDDRGRERQAKIEKKR